MAIIKLDVNGNATRAQGKLTAQQVADWLGGPHHVALETERFQAVVHKQCHLLDMRLNRLATEMFHTMLHGPVLILTGHSRLEDPHHG